MFFWLESKIPRANYSSRLSAFFFVRGSGGVAGVAAANTTLQKHPRFFESRPFAGRRGLWINCDRARRAVCYFVVCGADGAL
jgi:hypothetical protein